MDTLSHALYGKGLFGYKKYRWYSFFFGVIPDIFFICGPPTRPRRNGFQLFTLSLTTLHKQHSIISFISIYSKVRLRELTAYREVSGNFRLELM